MDSDFVLCLCNVAREATAQVVERVVAAPAAAVAAVAAAVVVVVVIVIVVVVVVFIGAVRVGCGK